MITIALKVNHICTQTHTYAHIDTQICIQTHTNTCKCIQTHTQTHTHVYYNLQYITLSAVGIVLFFDNS